MRLVYVIGDSYHGQRIGGRWIRREKVKDKERFYISLTINLSHGRRR